MSCPALPPIAGAVAKLRVRALGRSCSRLVRVPPARLEPICWPPFAAAPVALARLAVMLVPSSLVRGAWAPAPMAVPSRWPASAPFAPAVARAWLMRPGILSAPPCTPLAMRVPSWVAGVLAPDAARLSCWLMTFGN